MHSGWHGETEAGSWKRLRTASSSAQAGRAITKETKEDLDSPGLVSMQWLAFENLLFLAVCGRLGLMQK